MIPSYNQLLADKKALEDEVGELKSILKHIAFTYCGIEIGKPLEGTDEAETDVSMIPAFVEGSIDKQAYRADKAELELSQLKASSIPREVGEKMYEALKHWKNYFETDLQKDKTTTEDSGEAFTNYWFETDESLTLAQQHNLGK